MQKKIWLINHYAMPPDLEPRVRTVKLSQFLTQRGFDVTIIAASSMHGMAINLITDKNSYKICNYGNIKFIHIKARNYNSKFSRVLNLLEFPLRLLTLYSKFDKPDIIIQTATVPFGNLLYFMAKKLRALYILEILDLWPEAFHMTGTISSKNPMLKLLYAAEKWQYERADKLIFSMEGGKDYIVEKKWDIAQGGPIDLNKVYHINNGIDLEEFDHYRDNYSYSDPDLNDHNTFKVIYIGAIRLFNNLKFLIDAAELLLPEKKIKFLIYGDGNERVALEKYVYEKGLSNVIFKEKFVDKKYIPYIVSSGSLNIVNYQQNGLWKYGGSQTKMFLYLASGKPICSNVEPEYCLIKKYNCGISRNFGAVKEYAEAIESIAALPEHRYEILCKNARKGAQDYDFKVLTDELIRVFK